MDSRILCVSYVRVNMESVCGTELSVHMACVLCMIELKDSEINGKVKSDLCTSP